MSRKLEESLPVGQDQLKAIDKMIRSGDIYSARKLMRQLTPAELTRPQKLEVSNLARRVGRHLFSLQLLGKTVERHRESRDLALPEELISYVGSLIKLGFFSESEKWLKELDHKAIPDVDNWKGRLFMAKWQYREAIFFLKRYLKTIDTRAYSFLVGSLNLSASLLASGEPLEAKEILSQTLDKAIRDGNQLICGNALELMAQAHFEIGDYDSATRDLERSLKYLSGGSGIWSFYAKKWKWMIRAKLEGPSDDLHQKGLRLKEEALLSGYWEGVRDMDRVIATTFSDRDLALKVYFGTYYEAYRKRLIEHFAGIGEIPRAYDCRFFNDQPSVVLVDPRLHFAKFAKLGQLLSVLTKDLYRPLSLGYLFHNLYDERFFDPYHSPDRIYALVKRLRKQLGSELGLKIDWSTHGVRIRATRPIILRLNLQTTNVGKDQTRPRQLRSNFGKKWFTSEQASQLLGSSRATANRCIQESKKIYRIETQGRGRSTRYRFK